MRCFCFLAALLLPVSTAALAAEPASEWTGQSLSRYLDSLNRDGARIIYTSDLVTEDMRLDAEPAAGMSFGELRTVLRPFGLTVEPGPSNSLLIVSLEAESSAAARSRSTESLDAPIPEIVVTSSLHRLEYSSPTTHTYLDRELATRIPTTADEAVRLTGRLPGTANGGVSTRNHIRGGEANEVLFRFDGLRLYEPYHLKDFQTVATIVNSSAIGGMDFYTGAYPARFGDRMSGVLDIALREPTKPVETELALSFFNASALSMGTFGDDEKGTWLLSARRGNLDLIADIVDPDRGSPEYSDYLGRVGWRLGPLADLSLSVLVSRDRISLNDASRGETATASYSNEIAWAKWLAEWSDRLSSETVLAASDITNRRRGILALSGIVSGSLQEASEFSVVELRQDWQWLANDNWMLSLGGNLRRLDADYRFSSLQAVESPFDSILDNQPATSRNFVIAPSGNQYAAYGELRWQPASRWTIDFGLRWDQQNYTTADDDEQYSPRASLLYTPAERTELRIGWGQYYQAQEINELQLSDGISAFFPAQRAEHFVISLQHGFSAGVETSLSAYRKSFRTLRPRFENVFNSLTLLPELQFDRVRIDPFGAEAVGIEFTVNRGSSAEDVLWWLGYSWSRIDDQTTRGDVKRSWDQTHTVKAGVSWRYRGWDFSAAGEVHTGWPKTTMTGELVALPNGGTALELDVSPRNTLRYSVFHTFDVRVSRRFDVKRGDLTGFLEISNLYDRSNPCCTEYSLLGDGSLTSREAHWLPLVPSLGIVWQF